MHQDTIDAEGLGAQVAEEPALAFITDLFGKARLLLLALPVLRRLVDRRRAH